MLVQLEVIEGAMKGTRFEFAEHDTFVFGRSSNAKCRLPNDRFVSRNHFLLDINPPKVWLRDLGSLNGTFVNEVKFGSRDTEQPQILSAGDFSVFLKQNLANRGSFETELFDGDIIIVGDTKISVLIDCDAECKDCGKIIDSCEKEKYQLDENIYQCKKCKIEEQARIEGEEETFYQAPPKADSIKKSREAERFAADFIMQLLGEVNVGKPKIIDTFPGYEVLKKIGEGGMGAVYLAKDIKSGKPVAIKIIRPENQPGNKEIARFKREGKLNYELKHENIVCCYKTDYDDGVYYIVMEYVDGIDIQTLMKQKGRIDVISACKIIIDVLDGLKYMHNQNVVHRDIKPPNILLAKNGNQWIPKIADFGLAKNLETSATITAKGDIAGSLPYMPAEQIFDFKNITAASDVFSLGATLYTMCSGHYVHDYPKNKDPFLINIQEATIPIEHRLPNIPLKIAEVINKSVALNVNNRIQTAQEMQMQLIKAIS